MSPRARLSRAGTSAQLSEPSYRAVFFDAADAILILDDHRAIVEANPAAGAMFGARADALVGRPFGELLAEPPEEVHDVWRALLAEGEAKREHRIAGGAGPRRIECSYRARVQAGRHLCVARDVTERRLLEERVMQSEKIESVGRLAGGIAHDFNNLLTAILGFTEVLLGRREAGDPDRGDLEEVRKAAQRAAALTAQLLAFSRKQVLVPKDVDLNRTVAGLQGMLGRLIREDIAVSCELADRPAIVRIDPHQIEQVILNLVLNARDALPDGGHIRLQIRVVGASHADLPPGCTSAAREYVQLRVIDDGVGMSEEVRRHLFEPFFTTKALGRGTGLGLASVHGIVRQSSGTISVESEPGRGTTCTMHFPAVRAAERTETECNRVVERAPGRGTILLVEDEDSVRVVIGAALRRQGYQVLEASTPRGAWSIFERHPDLIGLLLSDVVMPEMNGPALAQRLVVMKPELRVLFVSGYSDLAAINWRNPNVSFLSKPFPSSVLVARVDEMLSRPRLLQ